MKKINIKDYSIGGVDSFFPKCFIISNMQDQNPFFEEMVLISCESFLKLFIVTYEKNLIVFNTKD